MSKVNSIAKFPRGLIWRTASVLRHSVAIYYCLMCVKRRVFRVHMDYTLERSFQSALNILFQLTLLRGAHQFFTTQTRTFIKD